MLVWQTMWNLLRCLVLADFAKLERLDLPRAPLLLRWYSASFPKLPKKNRKIAISTTRCVLPWSPWPTRWPPAASPCLPCRRTPMRSRTASKTIDDHGHGGDDDDKLYVPDMWSSMWRTATRKMIRTRDGILHCQTSTHCSWLSEICFSNLPRFLRDLFCWRRISHFQLSRLIDRSSTFFWKEITHWLFIFTLVTMYR